jgi:hypothetical protein
LWKGCSGDKWHCNRRENFEEVSSFKYLGSLMKGSNDLAVDVKEKIAVGKRCFYALESILRARYISRKIKTNIYKTIIKPAVLFDSVTWTLAQKSKQLIL